MGPAGPTPTETAMSARNTGGQTLAVVPEGTAVPLSSEQILRGFTANPGSTSFTVPETGAYLIFYHVQVQESAGPLTARAAGGGAVLPGSSSGRMGAGFYGACFVADLTAGGRLEVQLAGDTEIVLLQDGSGAGLSAVRLS